jgi:hypothetical protein
VVASTSKKREIVETSSEFGGLKASPSLRLPALPGAP